MVSKNNYWCLIPQGVWLPEVFSITNFGQLSSVFTTSRLPGDEYTGVSQLHNGKYTGKSQLSSGEYTREAIMNTNISTNMRKNSKSLV